jgi:uncharacterized damage-inducible protein DinB
VTTDHLGGRFEERELLVGFTDWYRGVIVDKVEGLSLDDATRVMTPTGLSPLAIVAHLAACELGWFVETFDGRPVDPLWDDYGEFKLRDDDTVESVLAMYAETCERSRSVVASAASLDELSADSHHTWGQVTLRWVMLHMLEETARHAGHLDLMREQIDGKTG